MAVGAIFEIGASVGLLLLFEPDIELGLPAGSDGAHAGARRPFGVEVPM
ncbi:lantibiotic dehydratase family protein [Mesorhizobium sp. J428]|nr:lantibiotic dehydratase family protein [Mesorhizobium sp. J428]MCR5860600.1 lantibiotic dehydratase family protein [Mesorhizobium sp. J428]